MNYYPLVSILINNYNYGHFLQTAIDSALNQIYQNIEVIVVDDGSTDNSHGVIVSYGDQIIPVFKANGGQASAFNSGFDTSQGEIICFLDADDLFTPDKIIKIVEIFRSHQNLNWIFHPLQLVDKQFKILNTETYRGTSGIYDLSKHLRRGKLRGHLPFQSLATSGMCFQRSCLEKILPMPEIINITSDDYIKYAGLGLGKGFILLEPLAQQRIHGNNAYTLRPDKQALRAKIAMLTAYWLRVNFPELVKFANNLFAAGLSTYQSLDNSHNNQQKLIDKYLSLVNPSQKLEIYLRSFYRRLKNYFSGTIN